VRKGGLCEGLGLFSLEPIKKGQLVTCYTGELATNNSSSTSTTHTCPIGGAMYGDADGLCAYVSSELPLAGSLSFGGGFSLAGYFIPVTGASLGGFVNSSRGTLVAANLSHPNRNLRRVMCNARPQGPRKSARCNGGPPTTFFSLPMTALRDIDKGEEFFWDYPWRNRQHQQHQQQQNQTQQQQTHHNQTRTSRTAEMGK
jgi:hypothetical protein